MLPPDYLINRLDDVTTIYADLHTAVLESIAKHVADTLRATGELGLMPSTRRQIESAQAVGLLQDDIAAYVATALSVSAPEIKKLFMDAAVKSLVYDNRVYEAVGLEPINIKQSPTMLRILNASINKQMGTLRRMTGTIALNAEPLFERTLNTAYMKTISVSHSYTEALNEAIDEMAREGTKTFDYASGRSIAIESAILMNLRTSISLTCAEMSKQGLKERGCWHVQVSAHRNSRPTHEVFQGRVFSWPELLNEEGFVENSL